MSSRTFIVTDVDRSSLRTVTKPLPQKSNNHIAKEGAQLAAKLRDAFANSLGDLTLGIKELGRYFRVVDESGQRKIDKKDLKKAIHDIRASVTDEEVDGIFSFFDKKNEGLLPYGEFMDVVRGQMSERRKQLVIAAFRKIDSNRDGVLSVADLRNRYNAAAHDEVIRGDMTEAQVLQGFCSIWNTKDHVHGLVSFAEFEDYYNGISAAVDSDEAFETLVKSSWKF